MLKIQSRYHILKFEKKQYLDDIEFGLTYRFTYNTFNKEIALIPLDEKFQHSDKFSLVVKSYTADKKSKTFFCDNCYGEGYMKVKMKDRKCFNHCGDCSIMFQCDNEECEKVFCIQCKFKIKVSDRSINCLFGHQIQRKKCRLENYLEKQ